MAKAHAAAILKRQIVPPPGGCGQKTPPLDSNAKKLLQYDYDCKPRGGVHEHYGTAVSGSHHEMGVCVGGGKAAVRGAAKRQQGTEEPGRGIRGAHFRALLHGHDPHRAGQAVHRAGAAGAAAGGRAEAGGAPAAQLRRAAGGADPCHLRLLRGGGFFAAGSPQRAAAGTYPGERCH